MNFLTTGVPAKVLEISGFFSSNAVNRDANKPEPSGNARKLSGVPVAEISLLDYIYLHKRIGVNNCTVRRVYGIIIPPKANVKKEFLSFPNLEMPTILEEAKRY